MAQTLTAHCCHKTPPIAEVDKDVALVMPTWHGNKRLISALASVVAVGLARLVLQSEFLVVPTWMPTTRVAASPTIRFTTLAIPELTTWLVGNYTKEASEFYATSLSEQQAEVWLHRGLERHPAYTPDINEAEVVFVCAYLHLNKHLQSKVADQSLSAKMPILDHPNMIQRILHQIFAPHKTHVVAIPTWNPTESRKIGLQSLTKALDQEAPTLALGLERNRFWHPLPPDRIVPVPYVVQPPLPPSELSRVFATERTDRVFYRGDRRPHAIDWSGCNRSMVEPLVEQFNVRLVSDRERMSVQDYNQAMIAAQYCLVLCGDTPTSRTLASAMVSGCIPLRIGSRWRGLCEPPCHSGWGWSIANASHLPFAEQVRWQDFPELDEAALAERPVETLEAFLAMTGLRDQAVLRRHMAEVQLAFVYGWGDPIESNDFGKAVDFTVASVLHTIGQDHNERPDAS